MATQLGSAAQIDAEAPWAAAMAVRLAARDAAQRVPFAALFPALNDAVALAESRAADLALVHAQLDSLKSMLADTSGKLALALEQGTPESLQRAADLEQQIKEIKEERAELYKTNAANAQRVLSLMDTSREQEESIKQMKLRIEQLEATNKTLSTRVSDRDELVKEKDHVIQILRDELSTHQLELVQREEQLRDKEKRVVDLEAENRTLLDRWMELKQKEVAKMNEANEFVEAALKSKATAQKGDHPASKLFSIFSSVSAASLPGDKPSPILHAEKHDLVSILPSTAIHKTSAHASDINCIRINRDGTLIATGGSDNKLIIYDAQSCTPKMTLTGSLQAIMSTSFNNAGDCVLGTSNDNSAKIWSLATGRLRHTLTGHIGKVYSARFTDNNAVVTGSHDRTIKMWDLNKGYCTKTIFTLSSCNDLGLLDGDGAAIASGHLDNNLRMWDTRSAAIIREVSGIHFGQITGVEVTPGFNQVLTTSRDNTIKLIDLRTYNIVQTYTDETFHTGMNWTKSCISPDGRYVASGSSDGGVYFWDAVHGNVVLTLREHHAGVCGVVWHPHGGDNVYSASDRDRCVIQWGSKLV